MNGDVGDKFLEAVVDRVVEKILPGIIDQIISHLPSSQERTMDVLEAAEHIGISKELLYRMSAASQIPHIRIGVEGTRKPKLLFSSLSLDNWKREQERENYRPAKGS